MNPDQDKSHSGADSELPLETEIAERLRAVKSQTERRTLAGLLRGIGGLPLEQARAALETSAAIAAVSLRASIDFLRAAPAVAEVLEPAELRAWGELGRRLTMADVESGISFFTMGVSGFAAVPSVVRPFVFQVCARQMILSATTAADTFRDARGLAEAVGDAEALRTIYSVAASIARRSAKHSAEFLAATPQVIAALGKDGSLVPTAIDLVKAFAESAGGIAADAWASLPAAIAKLSGEQAMLLMKRSLDFLERGGAAALHVMLAGGEVLRTLPDCFDDWIELLWAIAPHGNAGLVAFIRSSPPFFQNIIFIKTPRDSNALARRVILLTRDVARVDAEAALACLRVSAKALHRAG